MRNIKLWRVATMGQRGRIPGKEFRKGLHDMCNVLFVLSRVGYRGVCYVSLKCLQI